MNSLHAYSIAYFQAYFILDEFLLAGEIQETSKKRVLNAIKLQVLSNIKIRNASIIEHFFYLSTKHDSQKCKDVEWDSKPGFRD